MISIVLDTTRCLSSLQVKQNVIKKFAVQLVHEEDEDVCFAYRSSFRMMGEMKCVFMQQGSIIINRVI